MSETRACARVLRPAAHRSDRHAELCRRCRPVGVVTALPPMKAPAGVTIQISRMFNDNSPSEISAVVTAHPFAMSPPGADPGDQQHRFMADADADDYRRNGD